MTLSKLRRLLNALCHASLDGFHKEMRLWPHGSSEIYDALHRILIAEDMVGLTYRAHILIFLSLIENEFVRLHAAIRLVLPLIPSIAASSPFADQEASGYHDTRLHTYKSNQRNSIGERPGHS